MRLIIDRREGEYFVCEQEDKTFIDIEVSRVEKGARAGDVLSMDGDVIVIDSEATRERSEKIKELMKDMWRDG